MITVSSCIPVLKALTLRPPALLFSLTAHFSTDESKKQ